MDSARRTAALPAVGFPIRTSPDQSLVSGSPKLIAATRVLLRLLSPRHPSCALSSLVVVSSRSQLRKQADPKTKVQPGRIAPRLIGATAPVTLMPTALTTLLARMQLSKIACETEVSLGPSRLDASPRKANCALTWLLDGTLAGPPSSLERR